MLHRESSGRAPLFVLVVCLYVAILLSLVLVVADPPQPFGIEGWIFGQDGVTKMPLGTSYSINDSTTGFFLENVTRIPFPGQSSRYSETVSGNTGDNVIVRAWNSTHWGYNNVTLTGDMEGVNVTLNMSRTGWPNVTLLTPLDSTLYAIGDNVSIQANLTVSWDLGALNCNATLTFSTPGVITLQDDYNFSIFLGNLSRRARVLLNWSANASAIGNTNLDVSVVCEDNQTGFDTTDSDSAYDQHVRSSVPPSPHGVAGWIFDSDGTTQVPLGTYYEIRDYDSGLLLLNETRIPFPGYSGRYSESLNGVDGDRVNVTAWNDTHWGFTYVLLDGDMDNVNVTLDTFRPSETNVTIIFPYNLTPLSKFQLWNVTASVQIIGGSDGENCSATISFEDEDLLNITSDETYTKSIGNITLWNLAYVTWNVTAEVGLVNVTVNASCDSDGRNFEGLNWNTITANITLPGMFVSSLVCDNPINLQEATIVAVQCNVTIFNGNLAVNISVVNGTLYDNATSSAVDSDDNNDHYTNTTCDAVVVGEYEANYTCVFPLWYYANNGTWIINITAFDNVTLLRNSSNNVSVVNSLFALAAGTQIDFGNLAPTDTSATDVNLTLTNTGNRDINISVYGFGTELNDNLSMNCSEGNISVQYVHYNPIFNQAYGGMSILSNTSTPIADFILYQRTDDTDYDNDQNETYWKVNIPMGTKGFCNGTVIVSASSST